MEASYLSMNNRPHVKRMSATWPHPRRHQRGVIGVVGAVALLFTLAFAAISIDTGRLYMERRNLQKIADMAALGAARFTGCGSSITTAQADAQDIAQRNGLDMSPTAIGAGDTSIATTLGTVSINDSNKQVYQASAVPTDLLNAAQVVVTKKVPASILLGGILADRIQLSASATAAGGPPTMVYSMGASIITIDNAFTQALNNLFESVLKTSPQIKANVFQQLAASTVSLDDLRQAGGYSSVEAMMADKDLTLATLLTRYSNAAQANKLSNDTQTAISQLINAAGPNNLTLKLSDVLALNPGDKESLSNAKINLLDLIKTSIAVAGKNAKYQLEMSTNVVGLKMGLKLIDIPQIILGRGAQSHSTGSYCSKSSSAEVQFSFGLDPNSVLIQLINVPIAILGVKIVPDMLMTLSIGNAAVGVNYIAPAPGTSEIGLNVKTSIAKVIFSGNNSDEGFLGVENIFTKKRSGYIVNNSVIGDGTAGSKDYQPIFINVPISLSRPVHKHFSSQVTGSLADLLQSRPELVPTGLSGLASLLVTAINKLLDLVNNVIYNTIGSITAKTIDPLLTALGVNLGSADVNIFSIDSVPPYLISVENGP